MLLADALDWLVDAARAVGGKLIVDAIEESARRFYEHHGFKPHPVERRLYLATRDAVWGASLKSSITDFVGDTSSPYG